MGRGLLALVLLACSAPAPRPAPSAPRSDAVDGCDARQLRAVLRQTGARSRGGGHYRGPAPIGPPTARLARCEVGAGLDACVARHARRGHEVWVAAATERRERFVPTAPRGRLEAELVAMSADGAPIDVGRRVRERVVTRPRVCVTERATRRVRVPERRGDGADVLAVLDARRAHPEVVFDLSDASRLAIRCAAEGEAVARPTVRADGPCGELAGAALSYRVARR